MDKGRSSMEQKVENDWPIGKSRLEKMSGVPLCNLLLKEASARRSDPVVQGFLQPGPEKRHLRTPQNDQVLTSCAGPGPGQLAVWSCSSMCLALRGRGAGLLLEQIKAWGQLALDSVTRSGQVSTSVELSVGSLVGTV